MPKRQMSVSPFHRLALFLISGILAVGFGFVLIPPTLALHFLRHGGYFLIFTTFIGFVVALSRFVKQSRNELAWTNYHSKLAGLCIGIAVVWQFLEPHGFKILMDEMVLTSTSMNLHFEREVFTPMKAHNFQGNYLVLGGLIDKRPLFFPFLLSIIHDFSGYRSGNVFALNGILSFACLFLSGILGRQLGRDNNAGFLAVILLAGLPLLISNATGAGFEILNLAMLTGSALLAINYLKRPDPVRLDVFVFAVVLLAQTRYESALFVVSAGIIIVAGWFIARKLIVSWGLIATPLLLITIPLQNKVFTLNKGYWQLAENDEGPFRPEMVSDNLGHTIGYFFNMDGFRLGSPVLSAIGLVCFLIAIVYTIRRIRRLDGEPETIAFAAFAVIVLANFVLVLSYYWGQLDDFVASRLGLPLLLFFSLASAFVLGRNVKQSGAWGTLLTVPILWAFLAAIPIASQAEATTTYISYRETRWELDFIKKHRAQNALFILPSSLSAIIEREPAIPIEIVKERAEELAFHLNHGTYQDVYVFQRLELIPATNETVFHSTSILPPEFILETVEERTTGPLFKYRLSRLLAMDLSLQRPHPVGWEPRFPKSQRDTKEKDRDPTNEFLSEFIYKLP